MSIFTDFAPNETLDDAYLSFKILIQPWRWLKGKDIQKLKKELIDFIFPQNSSNWKISLFLTGRSALFNLLKSLNLKPDDEILVQAFTCLTVILPIINLKLKPIYVDIEPYSFSMNPNDLKSKISPKTKVLILQHTFGITPIYREKILSLVKKHNLVLIEDLAHMIKKIKIKKEKIENHYFLLSFGRSKSVSSVFGGAIVGNNKKIMKKLDDLILKMPSYNFVFKCLIYKPIVLLSKLTYNIKLGKIFHKLSRLIGLYPLEISKKEKEGHFDENYNKAFPNALAVLLSHQLKKIDFFNKNRQQIVNFYLKSFSKKINKFSLILYFNKPLLRFPLLLKNRDKIIEDFSKKGIFLGKWYNWPVAPKELSLNKINYKLGSCKNAEKLCQQIINLPTTNINLSKAKMIIKYLKKYF